MRHHLAMDPITIPGRVITLRDMRSDDAADAWAIVGDDRVTQWLSFDSRDQAAAVAMVEGTIERARHTPAPSTT